MNSEELVKQINESDKKIEEYFNLMKRNNELKDIFIKSAFFNGSYLATIISKLISEKEGRAYIPVHLGTYDSFKEGKPYLYGIAKQEKTMSFENYNNTDEDNERIYFSDSFIPFGTFLMHKGYSNPITFDCIFNKVNIPVRTFTNANSKLVFSENKKYYGIKCMSNFENYNYVNDYLELLFDMRVKGNGKNLSYQEMEEALVFFLKKDREKDHSKALNKVKTE